MDVLLAAYFNESNRLINGVDVSTLISILFIYKRAKVIGVPEKGYAADPNSTIFIHFK